MKTHAKVRYLITITGLAAVLAMPPRVCRAEDKQPAADGYVLFVANGMLTYNGHSEPANLRTAVEALRMRYKNANIVFAPELGDVGVPDLKLRAHDLSEMLEAIRVACGGKFDWMGPGSPGLNLPPNPPAAIDPATGLPSGALPDDSSTGLYVLKAPRQTGENERTVEAFNLEPYIKSQMREYNMTSTNLLERAKFALQTSEEVQRLITDTVASYERGDSEAAQKKMEFRYHGGANLLVVIGTKEDIDVARKVVGPLTGGGNMGLIRDRIVDDPEYTARTIRGSGGSGGESEPVLVEGIPVKSANLASVYAAAMSLLQDKRSKVVMVDERTKTLIVQGTKTEVGAIKKAMEQLEQASKAYEGDGAAPKSATIGTGTSGQKPH